MNNHNEVYLDNAATTKPLPSAVEATTRALAEEYGNASSIHARGQGAKALLKESREVLADALGVEPSEIYFTSGATEANNLAIRGAAEARGRDAGSVITSELEHPSVTRSVRGLRRAGWTTKHIPAPGGLLDLDALDRALADPVQLISVMQVQNEIGYVFPVAEVARRAKGQGWAADGQTRPLVHMDATQAFGKFEVRPIELGADLLSVASHKIGGPKGIGALYVRKGTKMFTTAFGGGQERGLRSGTEPVFLAAGFAAAVKETMAGWQQSFDCISQLKSSLLDQLRARFPNLVVHSRDDGSPYIVSFAIPGCDSKKLVRDLSSRGIYVSHASACSYNESMFPKGTWREKHPLSMQAAGISEELTASTLRVSFCPSNSAEDVRALVDALAAIEQAPECR